MAKNKVKTEVKEDQTAALLKAQLARALADYDNLAKRVERERGEEISKSSLRLILRLLPIVDNLRNALSILKDAGLAITLGELENVLRDEGVEEIRVKVGDTFDHNLEEATEVVESETEDNKIVEVVLSGWKYHEGTVIRHAKVKVSKIKEEIKNE